MKKIFMILTFLFLFCFFAFSEELVDISVLSEEARSSNYLSKLFAIDLLGDVADENYRNFFILALNNDKDSWIRYYAALALSNLNMDSQISYQFNKMLTDKENEPWLRKKIAEILYKKTNKKVQYLNEKDIKVQFEPEPEKNKKDEK